MFAERVRVLTVTFWAGSLWTIGYLVAPLLFVTLPDRALAGTIAGTLFRAEAWLSVVCAVLVASLVAAGPGHDTARKRTLWLLVTGMLICTLVGYFGLHPLMAALREAAGPGGTLDADSRMRFGVLHGASSVFYLIQSLLAVRLTLKIR